MSSLIPKSWLCWKNYTWALFRSDLFAGVTVGIVTLPLAMAFAIASGVGPERGLYTAIVAGFLISLFGGSRYQIAGPTGAFVIIVYGIIQRHGYDGLILATLIAALLLIIAGVCRLGSWIKFIPYPLVTGFTSGIALVIFSTQLKDFFGLKMEAVPADFIEQWGAYWNSFATFNPLSLTLSLSTLALILLVRRFVPKIPWGIAAIFLSTAACTLFHLPVETIASRFGEIPRYLPMPGLPEFHISFSQLHTLIPDALVIAFLAGIESLLSAVVADGMTGGRHKSNIELIGQGIGNIGSAFFGGIPATGAIARTATNIKAGGKTPAAGIIHSLTLLLILFAFAPLVGKIPMPSLAAILMMIAWNMSEIGTFRNLLKAPTGDVVLLLTTFALTILVDLTVAVEVGMVFAAFLFMKRMSIPSTPDRPTHHNLPPDVEYYEITGPFFFGVANHLIDLLHNIEKNPRIFILNLQHVPLIDATGLHALKEFHTKCTRNHTTLYLISPNPSINHALKKFGLLHLIGKPNLFPSLDKALNQGLTQSR